jgi:hypothetical protein
VESPHDPALHPSGPREPPNDPPHGTTPDTSVTPGHAGVLAGSFVPHDGAATRPCVERDNVDKEVDTSPADAPLDVNTRTHLAYDNARALNSLYYAGPHHTLSRAPAATHHDASPVRNTYPRHQPLRQTILPETFGRERRPGVPTPVDTSSGEPGVVAVVQLRGGWLFPHGTVIGIYAHAPLARVGSM